MLLAGTWVRLVTSTSHHFWSSSRRRMRDGILNRTSAAPSVALAALISQRLLHYFGLGRELRPGERAAAVPLGLCCDMIYSTCFLYSAMLWVVRGKSLLAGARGGAQTLRRPSA